MSVEGRAIEHVIDDIMTRQSTFQIAYVVNNKAAVFISLASVPQFFNLFDLRILKTGDFLKERCQAC